MFLYHVSFIGTNKKIHFFVPFNVVERQSLTFNYNSTVTLGGIFQNKDVNCFKFYIADIQT